jgi:hypothetical protein
VQFCSFSANQFRMFTPNQMRIFTIDQLNCLTNEQVYINNAEKRVLIPEARDSVNDLRFDIVTNQNANLHQQLNDLNNAN